MSSTAASSDHQNLPADDQQFGGMPSTSAWPEGSPLNKPINFLYHPPARNRLELPQACKTSLPLAASGKGAASWFKTV